MRNVAKLATIAATAVVAGGTALAAGAGVGFLAEKFASGKGKSGGGAPGCSPNNPLPHPGSAAEAGRIQRVGDRFKRLWPEVTGEGEMPPAALEIALAQAFLESGIAEAGGGGWWKDKSGDGTGAGNMVGSGNLGARQCGTNDSGGNYYTCVEYGDSAPNADGTQTFFPAKFRYYQAGVIGGKQRDAGDVAAYEFLHDITHQWPALAELKSGDVLAYAIRQGPKYRSADPPEQKVFGREYKGGNGYYGGFGATMQDRVGGYGRAIVSHLPAIAAALGHKKIFACIAPELLTGGATHAAVSGGCCGAPDPADIVLVHALADNPYDTDDATRGAEANIEGSATVATTIAAAVIAAGAGAWVQHHLSAKDNKKGVVIHVPKEMVDAARKKGKKRPAPPHAPPPLDEDRGSLAALANLPAAPIPWPTPPPLDDDRGSIAALRNIPGVTVSVPGSSSEQKPSAPLTREDIKQMFPTYTEAQIDDALKQLQGVAIEGIGTAALVVAALAAGGVYAGKKVVEMATDDMVQALRRNGVDVISPGAEPARGYVRIAYSDPSVRAALAEFDALSRSDAGKHVLQILSDKGFGLQKKSEALATGEHAAEILASPQAQAATAAMSRAAIVQGGRPSNVNLYCECPGCPINYKHVHAVCPEPKLAGERDVTPEAAAASDAYATSQVAGIEGAGTVAAVVAGGLVAGAAAAIALSRSKTPETAPAAPAPVVATVAAPAPSPKPQTPKKPTATQQEIQTSDAFLKKAKDDLAAHLATPPAPGAESPYQEKTQQLLAAVKDAEMRAAMAPVSGVLGSVGIVEECDTETGHGIIGPLDGSAPVHFNGAAEAGEFVAFEPVDVDQSPSILGTGQSLRALHLAGALPRARAIPGSSGRLVWYLAPPQAPSDVEGCPCLHGERFTRITRVLPVGSANDISGPSIHWQYYACLSGKATQVGPLFPDFGISLVDTAMMLAYKGRLDDNPCHDVISARMFRIPIDDAGPGAPVIVGATKEDEPDDADKALATASDATDAVSSLVNAIAKGKRAVERQVKEQDPQCRKLIRAWVEKHPLLARFTSPDLRALAGEPDVEGVGKVAAIAAGTVGVAAAALGTLIVLDPMAESKVGRAVSNTMNRALSGDATSFVDRYADEFARQYGDACEPTPEQDRTVLGALMAPLGLSQDQEDAIYTASSRGAGTLLDLYAPGAGQGAEQAADAISQLITGRKMAPGAKTKPTKKGPHVDAAHAAQVQLAAERVKSAHRDVLINEFVERHPHIVKWFKPDLRKAQ